MNQIDLKCPTAAEPADLCLRYVPSEPLHDPIGYRLAKRVADVVIAVVAIVLFSPLLVLTAVLIWFEDRGAILYCQPRVGRFGVPFWFYKFRSMRVDADACRAELLALSDADGAAFKMKQDPRITRIGRVIRKFSIDEMPQLFSVLGGHMSIIGPRPHLRSEVETYSPSDHLRLVVRPGLLCLREVSGRSKLSFDDWLRLDLEYIDRRSIWLDASILLRAIPAVVRADGAY